MSKESFFVEPDQMTSARPIEVRKIASEDYPVNSWILRAMIRAYDTKYMPLKRGSTISKEPLNQSSSTEEFSPVSVNELNYLIEKFRKDPVRAHTAMRTNLIDLVKNQKIQEEDRKELLGTYLAAFLSLIVKLDHFAFPATPETKIFEGMPLYLPDGYSDLDWDKNIDPKKRSFEKMRVNKQKFYERTFADLFGMYWAFSESSENAFSDGTLITLAEGVLLNTNQFLPYDYQYFATRDGGKSVEIHTYRNATDAASACRQHALDAALLFLACGITGPPLKTFLNGGTHVNNMIHGSVNRWLADATNPEIAENLMSIEPFIKPVPLSTGLNYRWKVSRRKVSLDGQIYEVKDEYLSRRPTYYRVLDNIKNPVE